MSEKKKNVIMICTEKLGNGNEELGRNLMKSYIYSLMEMEEKPRAIIFLNEGINLTTSGSPVLKMLRMLAAQGVEVLSCGACLDYYKKVDKLEVGEVTNMYYNVELMYDADNTIVIS